MTHNSKYLRSTNNRTWYIKYPVNCYSLHWKFLNLILKPFHLLQYFATFYLKRTSVFYFYLFLLNFVKSTQWIFAEKLCFNFIRTERIPHKIIGSWLSDKILFVFFFLSFIFKCQFDPTAKFLLSCARFFILDSLWQPAFTQYKIKHSFFQN